MDLIKRRNKPSLSIQTGTSPKYCQYCPKRDFIIKCIAVFLIMLVNVLLLVFDWYFQMVYFKLYVFLRIIIAIYYVSVLIVMDLDSEFPVYPSVICTIMSTINITLLCVEMFEAVLKLNF
jgi:hypothetical protein